MEQTIRKNITEEYLGTLIKILKKINEINKKQR